MTRSLLPPRRIDWKKGDTQVGLFIRFADGRLVEMTVNAATTPVAESAASLLRVMCGKEPK